jgi:DNA polymerase III sliding clamp (beta) subunit (PCNA family)
MLLLRWFINTVAVLIAAYLIPNISVQSERIVLKMSGATTPGVFLAEKDENLLHLIMPVRV